MKAYPAIDLLDGKVVRLKQGDFARQTLFEVDPLQMSEQIVQHGLSHLHLVDLSGARDPQARQVALIRDILNKSHLRIQVGGGVRSIADIRALLDAGAERVVVGSLAVRKPQVFAEAVQQLGPEYLTVALDVQAADDGQFMVMCDGWQQSSKRTLFEMLASILDLGLTRVLCTDIEFDGELTGPNFSLYQKIQESFPSLEVQASGGVRHAGDLAELNTLGVHSVVVGRAWLSGKVTLAEMANYAH